MFHGDEVVRALSPAPVISDVPEMACFTVSEILHCLLTYSSLFLPVSVYTVYNWNRTLPSGISLMSPLALTCLYFLLCVGGCI